MRIVQHAATTTPRSLEWRVEPVPSVVIDDRVVADGLFRVVGATRLQNGRIVVANAGTSQLRFFDSTGLHLFDAGGRGRGPGEFSRIGQLLRVAGDRLLMLDRSNAVWYDGDGRFLKQESLTPASADIGPFVSEDWILAPDGAFLMRVHHRDTSNAPRVGRQPFGLLRVVPATGAKRMLGWFRGRALTGEAMGRIRLFSPDTHKGFGRDRIYVGDSEDFEIRAYTLEGDLVLLIRWDAPPREVHEEHLAIWKRNYVSRGDAQYRHESELLVRDWPVSERFPFFDRLVGDGAGNLWVRRFRVPGSSSRIWTVFDSTGGLLGETMTPMALSVWEIGASYVLGLERDSLDTERVVAYRVRGGLE